MRLAAMSVRLVWMQRMCMNVCPPGCTKRCSCGWRKEHAGLRELPVVQGLIEQSTVGHLADIHSCTPAAKLYVATARLRWGEHNTEDITAPIWKVGEVNGAVDTLPLWNPFLFVTEINQNFRLVDLPKKCSEWNDAY